MYNVHLEEKEVETDEGKVSFILRNHVWYDKFPYKGRDVMVFYTFYI